MAGYEVMGQQEFIVQKPLLKHIPEAVIFMEILQILKHRYTLFKSKTGK
ncbi:hypothetical protein [Methanobacterium oryzae]